MLSTSENFNKGRSSREYVLQEQFANNFNIVCAEVNEHGEYDTFHQEV